MTLTDTDVDPDSGPGREFKTADYDNDAPPIPFTIDGSTFYVTGEMPGDVAGLLARAMGGGQRAKIAGFQLLDIFSRVMDPDAFAAFDEFLTAHRPKVGVQMLGDVMTHLIAAWSGRPFGQPSSSSPGSVTTPATSTDDSPSPDSTSTA